MDKLERIAKVLHDGWCEYQLARGRVYGPERTSSTHPHLVPWEALDTDSQNQDRFIAAQLLRLSVEKEVKRSTLPAAIHDSWAVWKRATNSEHPHAKEFAVAHSHGPEEHELQATKVASLLGDLSDE